MRHLSDSTMVLDEYPCMIRMIVIMGERGRERRRMERDRIKKEL